MKKILSTVLFAAMLFALPTIGHTQDWRATVPYHCGFDDPIENGAWILLNGDSTVANKSTPPLLIVRPEWLHRRAANPSTSPTWKGLPTTTTTASLRESSPTATLPLLKAHMSYRLTGMVSANKTATC